MLAKADEPAPPVPLAADRYVALSTLQKAIRRGEEDLALIPTLIDQNPYAQSRMPIDMMRSGCSVNLFQASQQWTRMSS